MSTAPSAAVHDDHSETPQSAQVSTQSASPLGYALIAIAVVALLVYVNIDGEDEETNRPAAAAPAAPVVYEDLSWSFREFDVPKGGQARYLWPGWRADPLGGDLTIITPSGQEVKAKPGKKIDIGWQEAGTYIFYPDPLGATDRKVDVLNQRGRVVRQ